MYYFYNSYASPETIIATVFSFIAVILFVSFVIAVLLIASYWKLFVKANEPGWKAIVPFYNVYTICKLVFSSGWVFLLSFVPMVNIVFAVVLAVRTAKAYGKGSGFAVGMLFFPYLFYPILAFSSSTYYLGNPANSGAMGGYPQSGYYPQGGYSQDSYQNQSTPYSQDGTMSNNNYDQGYYGQNNYSQNSNDF